MSSSRKINYHCFGGKIITAFYTVLAFLGGKPSFDASDFNKPPGKDAEAPAFEEGRAAYRLVLHDLQAAAPRIQPETCRVGISQIDLPADHLEDRGDGIFGLRRQGIDMMKRKIDAMIEKSVAHNINILVFPEMTVDMNHDLLSHTIFDAAKAHDMIIVPGSCHDPETRMNVSRIIGPEGVLWEQEKHIPAMITIGGRKIREDIASAPTRKTVVANTAFGRIAVVICRDFLDMDLRVEIKNFSPPVDIVINPALTPVTADFSAAHLEARRSLYAYFFFCNIASFGNSSIHSPEKGRKKRMVPPGKENLIFKDVNLFDLRAERRKWEMIRERHVRFIQSTR